MTVYKQGDVVLLPFPFTDPRTAKKRPAVIISADWFNEVALDYILVAISSKIPTQLTSDQFLLSTTDMKLAGLPKPSIIRLSKIATIEQGIVVKRLGKIPVSTLRKILPEIQKVIS